MNFTKKERETAERMFTYVGGTLVSESYYSRGDFPTKLEGFSDPRIPIGWYLVARWHLNQMKKGKK